MNPTKDYMKMKVKLIYIILLNLLTIYPVYSQWVQTDGPYGTVKITALFINNDKLYASSSCGLYSNTGPSGFWNSEATIDVKGYAVKDGVLYYGGNNIGIQEMNLSDPSKSNIIGLPGYSITTIKDGGTCLFAIDRLYFYKSAGYTKSWATESRGLPSKRIYYNPDGTGDYYFAYPNNAIETIDNWVYSGTYKGVYRADINTMTWRSANIGLPLDNVQVLRAIDGILFAGIVNDLFVSIDKGDNWMRVYDAASSISGIIRKDNQLYVSTDGSGIFTSLDNGQSWTPINSGLTDLFVTSMTIMNNMLICGTKSEGVFYYDGTSWTNNLRGMICTEIWSMTTTSNSLVASNGTDVYSSKGNSNSWQNIALDIPKHYFGSVTSIGDRIFLAYLDVANKQLIKYTDGNSWMDFTSIPQFKSEGTYQMVTKGNNLYVYDKSYLFSTNNLGASWNDFSNASGNNSNFNDLVIYKNIPFAAKSGNSELLRLDGNQWSSTNNGLPSNKEIKSIAYSSDAIYTYVYNEGIYVSRDNGMSWTKATNGFLPSFEVLSFASRDSNIFVSSAMGVFYSSDYGQNWNPMNEGIEGLKTGPLVIYNDTLFVGTMGNGVWKHDLDDFIPVVEKDTTWKVQHIKVFPNPADEFVRFDFTDYDKAQIRIFNILGSEMINTKLNSDRQIAVSKLVSGTYIIVITTDLYTYTSKLVIHR